MSTVTKIISLYKLKLVTYRYCSHVAIFRCHHTVYLKGKPLTIAKTLDFFALDVFPDTKSRARDYYHHRHHHHHHHHGFVTVHSAQLRIYRVAQLK